MGVKAVRLALRAAAPDDATEIGAALLLFGS
jgi:hypothetical protein